MESKTFFSQFLRQNTELDGTFTTTMPTCTRTAQNRGVFAAALVLRVAAKKNGGWMMTFQSSDHWNITPGRRSNTEAAMRERAVYSTREPHSVQFVYEGRCTTSCTGC